MRHAWKFAAASSIALALCSCRSAEVIPNSGLPPTIDSAAYASAPMVPPGYAADGTPLACGPDGQPLPLPYHSWDYGSWAPPGIARPWPHDEYLHDGGDEGSPVAIAPNWDVYGLELEDTVVHYDTIDGRTMVCPSNCVYVYAPRFGAVRQVTSLVANDQIAGPGDLILPQGPIGHDRVEGAISSLQREQVRGHVDAKLPAAYLSKEGDGALSLAIGPVEFLDGFLPHENFELIRTGAFDASEKARLAEFAAFAVTWSADQQVQVVIDGQAASATVGVEQAMVTYTVEDNRQPCLCLTKVASAGTAKPGDTIDFTLRFDNIGEQPLGNIVLLDNLTTRLEYVENSAQSSLAAKFSAEANDAGSSVLRWEITDPVEPGDGGIVRFQCRVR